MRIRLIFGQSVSRRHLLLQKCRKLILLLFHTIIMTIWIPAPYMYGDSVTWLVPLGLKAWFLERGIATEKVIELDWWEPAPIF